jgi:hypothetical protein
MAPRKEEGDCRLCGEHGPLSFEHVPPESAFNSSRVIRARREALFSSGHWDGRGDIQQRGGGAWTLCQRCNSKTGSWYAAEFVRWATHAAELMPRLPVDDARPIRVPFHGRPLPFLKQVVTMFFTVNARGFAEEHPELVKFVLGSDSRYLPPQYRVDMVLVRGGFARWSGLHGVGDLDRGTTIIASEVAHFPFAFRLFYSEVPIVRLCAIEHFGLFRADQRVSIDVLTVAGDIATKYPGDYRCRSRVDADALPER